MDPKAQQPHKTVTVSFEENVYVAIYSASSHAVTVHSITGPETNCGHERYGLGGASVESRSLLPNYSLCSFSKNAKTQQTVRGWGHFFRYCMGARRIFYGIDWCVRDRLWRWMRKKHPYARVREIMQYLQRKPNRRGRKVWREGKEEQFMASCLTVQRFRLWWMRQPDYAMISGESGVHNERCMPRSERGYGKLMAERSRGARSLLLQVQASPMSSSSTVSLLFVFLFLSK
jgi:hypothetical protein